MIINLQEIKHHLRIEHDEDNDYLELLIKASEEFIYNSTGVRFENTNPLAKTACLFIVGDLYENRSMTTDKMAERVRSVITSIMAQLSLSYGTGDNS